MKFSMKEMMDLLPVGGAIANAMVIECSKTEVCIKGIGLIASSFITFDKSELEVLECKKEEIIQVDYFDFMKLYPAINKFDRIIAHTSDNRLYFDCSNIDKGGTMRPYLTVVDEDKNYSYNMIDGFLAEGYPHIYTLDLSVLLPAIKVNNVFADRIEMEPNSDGLVMKAEGQIGGNKSLVPLAEMSKYEVGKEGDVWEKFIVNGKILFSYLNKLQGEIELTVPFFHVTAMDEEESNPPLRVVIDNLRIYQTAFVVQEDDSLDE